MENGDCRNEYVLNDEGMQFVGSRNRIFDIDWYFGQVSYIFDVIQPSKNQLFEATIAL